MWSSFLLELTNICIFTPQVLGLIRNSLYHPRNHCSGVGVAYFMPNVCRRESGYQPTKDTVFLIMLKHLKNQDNFSVWSKTDPNMKKTFTG
jgi:hypothetical protein